MIARLRRMATALVLAGLLLAVTGCIYVVVQKESGKPCGQCHGRPSVAPAGHEAVPRDADVAPAELPFTFRRKAIPSSGSTILREQSRSVEPAE